VVAREAAGFLKGSFETVAGQVLPVTGLTERPEAAIGGLPYEIQVIDPHAYIVDRNKNVESLSVPAHPNISIWMCECHIGSLRRAKSSLAHGHRGARRSNLRDAAISSTTVFGASMTCRFTVTSSLPIEFTRGRTSK
jgi:hypothetical protein